MVTPAQENELRRAVGMAPKSPAVDYAVPSGQRVSDDAALEAMFKDAGVDTQSLDQQIQAEQNKEKQDRFLALQKEIQGFESARKAGQVAEGVADAVLGVGVGFRDIARNTYNGLVDLADSAENYAAQHGIGSSDLITEANKWEDAYGKEVAKGFGTTGNVARSVTNFAGPLLATMGSGGSFLAASGVNAAYNFLAIDPKQARLSDHLKGTGLSEVPVASDVIDYLSTKPDDSELTSRFKNLVEGAGIDAAVGGILWGASKAYSGIKNLRSPKTLETAEKEVAAMKAPAPKPITPDEQAAINASDEAISQVAPEKIPQPKPLEEDPAQLDLFEKQWANLGLDQPPVYSKPDTGEVRLRLTDDQILDRFYVMSKQIDQQVLRTPMTDAELKSAAEIIRKDSATVDRLAKWTPDQGVPTDKETLVLKYVMQQGDASMREAIGVVTNNIKDDVALLKFSRELENYTRLLEIRQGTASAKGATLRAEKVIGALAKTGDKEALAMLGAQGRAKLVEGLLEQNGGRANIQKIAQSASFIEELAKISKKPDTDFAMRMGDVVQKSSWMKFNDAVTKVALNGMLSSYGTPLKAIITNFATTGKTVIDNYVQVGFGAVVKSEDAKTLAEANAHLKGVFSGLYEGIAPAIQVTKTGQATRFTRLDLSEGAQKIVTQEDAMFKASGAWASKAGLAAEALSLNGLPVRVLMGVDTYWQMVNYRGAINAEAIRAGTAQGLEGKELAAFIDAFTAKPPAAVDYAATQIAQTNTMAKDLTGFAESVDSVIDQGSQYIPFARVILPFFKTNMNIIEYTVKNSPFAPLLSPDFRAAVAAGGRARDEAMAKVISGTAILGGIVALAESGLINGRNTKNSEIEQALRDNKTIAPETSIKIGNTWYSLKGLEPLSTFVNMASNISKMSGYVSEEEYLQAITAIGIMTAEVATPEQLTDSLSGLLNVMAGKEGATQYLATIPSRFTPAGALMTDVRQTVDPTMRMTKYKDFLDTVFARFENQVPYLSKNLPAQRNVWGEKLVLPDGIGPDAISPMATTSNDGMALKGALERMDDFYEMNKDKAFGLYKFDLSMPSRQIKNTMANVQYQLTPQEYSAYVVLSGGINPTTGKPIWPDGRTLKQVVNDVVQKYDGFNKRPQDYDPTTYVKMVGELSKAFANYRKVADKLILQFGDVQAKMKAQADQYRAFEELNNER